MVSRICRVASSGFTTSCSSSSPPHRQCPFPRVSMSECPSSAQALPIIRTSLILPAVAWSPMPVSGCMSCAIAWNPRLPWHRHASRWRRLPRSGPPPRCSSTVPSPRSVVWGRNSLLGWPRSAYFWCVTYSAITPAIMSITPRCAALRRWCRGKQPRSLPRFVVATDLSARGTPTSPSSSSSCRIRRVA